MTKVEQTSYAKGQGNCLTACVASILNLPVSALPEFCVDGEWFDRLHSFCAESGFSLMYWKHSEAVPIICLNSYVILLLDLEGTDELHAVVGKTVLDEKTVDGKGETHWAWKTEIAHDPNYRGIPPVKGVNAYVVVGRP